MADPINEEQHLLDENQQTNEEINQQIQDNDVNVRLREGHDVQAPICKDYLSKTDRVHIENSDLPVFLKFNGGGEYKNITAQSAPLYENPNNYLPVERRFDLDLNTIAPKVVGEGQQRTINRENFRVKRVLDNREEFTQREEVFIDGNAGMHLQRRNEIPEIEMGNNNEGYGMFEEIDEIRNSNVKAFLYKELDRKGFFLPEYKSSATTAKALKRYFKGNNYIKFWKIQVERAYDDNVNNYKKHFNLFTTYKLMQYHLYSKFKQILPFDSTPDKFFVIKLLILLDPYNRLNLTRSSRTGIISRHLGTLKINGKDVPITSSKRLDNIKRDYELLNNKFASYKKNLSQEIMRQEALKLKASKKLHKITRKLINFPDSEKLKILNSEQIGVIDAISDSNVDSTHMEDKISHYLKMLGYDNGEFYDNFELFNRVCENYYKKSVSLGRMIKPASFSERSTLFGAFPYCLMRADNILNYRDLLFELGIPQFSALMEAIDDVAPEGSTHRQKATEVFQRYRLCFCKS